MIVEKVKITNNNRIKVTRICDDCEKKEKVYMSSVYDGRKSRGDSSDYCKKCSYKYRKLEHPKMEKSASWNGGRFLDKNGYYRVYVGNLKYAYEHKVIMSKALGRELKTEEKVHHIDCNKINNDISNLYVCSDKKEHSILHWELEKCVLKLLNKHVWFDKDLLIYTTHYCPSQRIEIDVSDLLSYSFFEAKRRPEYSGYLRFTNHKNTMVFGSSFLHVIIAERIIGRELSKRELVHHIDGNSLNNNPANLCVMNRSKHKICHCSLQNCGILLFKQSLIKFNKGYFLTQNHV